MAKTQTNAAEEHDGDDEFSGEVSSMLTFKLIDEQYLNSCFFFRRKKLYWGMLVAVDLKVARKKQGKIAIQKKKVMMKLL